MRTGKKKRGAGTLALAAGLLLALAPSQALAKWEADVPSSLTVAVGETAAGAFTDLVGPGIEKEVDLYQVAESTGEGAFTALPYFEAALGEELSAVDEKTTASAWQEMAKAATEALGLAYHEPRENAGGAPAEPRKAAGPQDEPDEELEPGAAEVPKWEYSFSGASGEPTGARFEPGLYLVYARYTDTDAHRYVFQPFLVALPNNSYRIATGDGSYPQGTPDDWSYDVEVDLKPEQWVLCGPVVVRKDLLRYNTALEAVAFTFRLEEYPAGWDGDPGALLSSWNTTLDFTGTGVQEARFEGIPAGHVIVVREEGDASSYQLEGMEPEDGQVTVLPYTQVNEGTEPEVTVGFRNTYEWEDRQGTGVVNHYDPSGTGAGWEHSSWATYGGDGQEGGAQG